jgi:anti-sigma28 factor (negative regulator of flagellin synthesis)
VQRRIERERRIAELRRLIQAGLFRVDFDRLVRSILQTSLKHLRGRLDVEPAC